MQYIYHGFFFGVGIGLAFEVIKFIAYCFSYRSKDSQ